MIELIITISIAAILASLAIPAYKVLIANNQTDELNNVIAVTLRVAKSEALHRGVNVKICAFAADGVTCNDTASNWQYGWGIFVPATGETLHVYYPKSASAVTINPASSIVYLPSGFPLPQSFSFTVQPRGCSQGSTISFSLTTNNGQLQTQSTSCP